MPRAQTLFSILTFGLFALACPTYAWSAAVDVKLTRPCNEHLAAAVFNNNLVFDSSLGILSVHAYDEATDTASVRFRDTHRTYRVTTNRIKRSGTYSQAAFDVQMASQRILAEAGHPDAISIIHERAQRLLGIKRSGLFFAMVGIKAHFYSNEIWKQLVLGEAIRNVNIRRQESGQKEVELRYVLAQAFALQANAKSPEAEIIGEIVREIYKISGENIIRSGLLQNYAFGYNRNWIHSGDPQHQRARTGIKKPSGGGHGEFIPQDVDHYVRGFLWSRSAELFKLERGQGGPWPELVNDAAGVSRVLRDSGSNRLVTIDAPYEIPESLPHVQMVATKIVEKDVPYWVPQAFSGSIRWRRIYDVAGTLDIEDPNQVLGQNVVLLVSAKASDMVADEVLRRLYDYGAARVIRLQLEP